MKVAMDKERIKRVDNMDLYQAKSRVKYLSDDDVKFLWEEKAEEIAEEFMKLGTPLDIITKATKIPIEKIEEMAKKHSQS
jgi:serine kinase of HPr protein (carbohydrate metabolism regulator)